SAHAGERRFEARAYARNREVETVEPLGCERRAGLVAHAEREDEQRNGLLQTAAPRVQRGLLERERSGQVSRELEAHGDDLEGRESVVLERIPLEKIEQDLETVLELPPGKAGPREREGGFHP